MTQKRLAEFFDAELEMLANKNLVRTLPCLSDQTATTITLNGRPCLLLCSNNYLGIADHPRLRKAAAAAAIKYGCSASASRLVSGNMGLYNELESALAEFVGKEDAVVFPSGYAANTGVIQSIAQAGDVILSDELNHASIVDGCRLSKADRRVFRHNDSNDLDRNLKKCSLYRMRLIVVEGLYSLDGDIAPLAEIVELAERYDCTLMVDEAHAIGVLGENGTGACELCKVANHVDIVMGTFGKALGSYGAFVAGSEQLKRFLVNKTRPLIYTTALPPAVLAASRAAIEIVREEPWRRRETLTKAAYLRQGLSEIGFDVGVSAAQIVPVIVGAAEQALQLAQALLDLGVFVQPIRPPTVPPGTSRLRVTVNAEHSYEQLNTALDAFGNARERLRNNVQAGVEQP